MPIDHSSRDALRNYFAVEQKRDIEAILALYAEDAVFTTPSRTYAGKSEIREFYHDAVTRFPILKVALPVSLGEGELAMAEWVAVMTDTDGVELGLTGANAARVVDGLIVEMRSHYDDGAYRG